MGVTSHWETLEDRTEHTSELSQLTGRRVVVFIHQLHPSVLGGCSQGQELPGTSGLSCVGLSMLPVRTQKVTLSSVHSGECRGDMGKAPTAPTALPPFLLCPHTEASDNFPRCTGDSDRPPVNSKGVRMMLKSNLADFF